MRTTIIADKTTVARIINPHINQFLCFSDISFFFDNKKAGIITKKNINGIIDELSLAPPLDETDRLPKTKNCKRNNAI